MIDYSLYLVTDDPSRYRGDWLDNVVAAVEGGVTCVQYRDTESAPDERLRRVRALQDALKGRVPLIINNEAELAAAVRAEGVHVGQSDLAPEKVRAIVGPDCEIGLSITDVSQIRSPGCSPSAAREDTRRSDGRPSAFEAVDALGIGPVFDARKTKADASDALGVAGLRQIIESLASHDSRLASLSAVAIGGITLANAAEVLATGVGGLAVVSAFSKAEDPLAIARAFRELLGQDKRRETRDMSAGHETRGERHEGETRDARQET